MRRKVLVGMLMICLVSGVIPISATQSPPTTFEGEIQDKDITTSKIEGGYRIGLCNNLWSSELDVFFDSIYQGTISNGPTWDYFTVDQKVNHVIVAAAKGDYDEGRAWQRYLSEEDWPDAQTPTPTLTELCIKAHIKQMESGSLTCGDKEIPYDAIVIETDEFLAPPACKNVYGTCIPKEVKIVQLKEYPPPRVTELVAPSQAGPYKSAYAIDFSIDKPIERLFAQSSSIYEAEECKVAVTKMLGSSLLPSSEVSIGEQLTFSITQSQLEDIANEGHPTWDAFLKAVPFVEAAEKCGFVSVEQYYMPATSTIPMPTEQEPKILPVPYYNQGNTEWCLPTSLAMVLKYYGKNIHTWDVAKEWGIRPEDGYDMIKQIPCIVAPETDFCIVKNYIDKFGDISVDIFTLYIIDTPPTPENIPELIKKISELANIKNYIDNGVPVIVGANKHAVVIVGYSKDESGEYFYVHDPSGAFVLNKGFSVINNEPCDKSHLIYVKVPVKKFYRWCAQSYISLAPIQLFIVNDKVENPPDAVIWSWGYIFESGESRDTRNVRIIDSIEISKTATIWAHVSQNHSEPRKMKLNAKLFDTS